MLTKSYRRSGRIELGPEIDKYSNQGDRAVLLVELSSLETLEVAVEASRRFPRSGLLAVTDKRLLYVEERLIMKPVVLSIPLGEIVDVATRFENVTGTIAVLLRNGAVRTFAYISPKERTSAVAAAIQTRLPPGTPAHWEPFETAGGSASQRLSVRVCVGAAALALAVGAYAVDSFAIQMLLLIPAGALAGVALGLQQRAHSQTKSRSERGVMAASLSSSLGVDVAVSGGAAETIVSRGGRLYLWQTSVGDAWLRDRLAFNEPDGPTTFRRIPAGLISIMIAEDVELPETLQISAHPLLPRRIDVEWNGRAWGRRGGVEGGGPA
jgi:hypothetical protein